MYLIHRLWKIIGTMECTLLNALTVKVENGKEYIVYSMTMNVLCVD